MIHILIRKLRSARTRLKSAISQRQIEATRRQKEAAMDCWISSLQTQPPQVLLGANFAEFGGVHQHLHAILRHSSLEIGLAPPDALLQQVGAHDIGITFRDKFLEFSPVGIRALHSHVFPWFIEWCMNHRGKGPLWVHTYHLPYFSEHARGEPEPWHQAFNDAQINKARHADIRISVARWQQRYLEDAHGIQSIYVPNGVELDACDRADPSRFLNPFETKPFVLYIGRNDPVKNPSAFVSLARQMPKRCFVMAGHGLDEASLQNDWNMEVPSNLALIGQLSHTATLDAIAASSAVVVTSHREGLPTLVLEVMARSKPIVVPDEKGCVEAVAHGDFGLIYTPGDISDLAEKTAIAVQSRTNSGARNRVAEEYDWRVVAPRLDAVYRGAGG